MIGRAAAIGFVVSLAACTVLQQPESERAAESWPSVKPSAAKPEPRAEAEPSVEMLLAEFERFRRLSAPDLAREQEAARQAYVQTRSDAARVQLAMALSVPGSPSS